MIDRKMFNDNFQYFDNVNIVEVIELYLSLYQQEFLNIRKSIAQKDFQDLASATCKLRGMVSCFYDPVVTEQSRRLETMTRNNNKIEDGLETLLDELEVNSGLMAEELKKMAEELIKDQK